MNAVLAFIVLLPFAAVFALVYWLGVVGERYARRKGLPMLVGALAGVFPFLWLVLWLARPSPEAEARRQLEVERAKERLA